MIPLVYPNWLSLERRKIVLASGIHYIYSNFVNFFEILKYSLVGFFLKHAVEFHVKCCVKFGVNHVRLAI